MVSELQQKPSMASQSPPPIHDPSTTPHLPFVLPSVLPLIGVCRNQSNYTIWKSQVLPTVKAYDLEGFLIGTKSSSSLSPEDPVNSEFIQWNRLDQFLLSWLLSSISYSMLGHIIHCKTASEIWKTLEQIFSTKSKARILNLRFMLQSTKKGSMTSENYFLKMKSLADELMVAGQPVSEDELVLYVSGGLGPEYESVVVTLTSKDSVSITEAQFLLQTHKSRLENFHSVQMIDVSSASANVLHKRDTTGFQNVGQYSYQSSSATRL